MTKSARPEKESAAPGAVAAKPSIWRSNWVRSATNGATKAKDWAVENPSKAAAIGAGVVMVVAPTAVATPVLGALGIEASSATIGSLAAQSGFSHVLPPALYAGLQSATGGSGGKATVGPAVQAMGGIVATSAGVMGLMQRGKQKKERVPVPVPAAAAAAAAVAPIAVAPKMAAIAGRVERKREVPVKNLRAEKGPRYDDQDDDEDDDDEDDDDMIDDRKIRAKL